MHRHKAAEKKHPAYKAFDLFHISKKCAKTQPNPQPYPLYPTFLNGVSPVRLWHRPVTIKNETSVLPPSPIPFSNLAADDG